jgi:hypothetical protein
MKQSQDKERLVRAVEVAEDMFWNAIATQYREIDSGDFPPDLAMEMADKLTQWVTVWLEMNEPTPAPKPEPKPLRTIEVMLHRIEYSYRDGDTVEITSSDEEHIAYCISQGISSGELCTIPFGQDGEVYGWWEINNNPN